MEVFDRAWRYYWSLRVTGRPPVRERKTRGPRPSRNLSRSERRRATRPPHHLLAARGPVAFDPDSGLRRKNVELNRLAAAPLRRVALENGASPEEARVATSVRSMPS